MRAHLTNLTLNGFKTIRELKDFKPQPLNVLIGANGAGKSNFISFFRLLSRAMRSPGSLQSHIAQSGGASAILHDGGSKTREMDTEICITTSKGKNEYKWRLSHAAGDILIFNDECYRYSSHDYPSTADWTALGAGHKESKIIGKAEGEKTAGIFLSLVRKLVVYQFHNTSETARIRNKWHVDEGRWLKEDGGNLAPFLYRLKQNEQKYYQRIVSTIRLILPFFADFELEPDYDHLLLQWRELNSDVIFSASQASDGMLRVMALVSLLLQPEPDLPDVVILDEPELGLHPYAIDVISGLIRAASEHVQIIVATQSVSFIDQFEPDEIVVVERKDGESTFHRLNEEDLKDWLEEYTVSELWEKNVFGGRPS